MRTRGSRLVVAALWAAMNMAGSALSARTQAPLPAAPDRGLSFLHVGAVSGPSSLPQIVDAGGREVLLKGVNVSGLSDYWVGGQVGGGKPADHLGVNYPIDPVAYSGACPQNRTDVDATVLCRGDLDQMRPFGYDLIRLTVSWSMLEPDPTKPVDATYLARIAQVVAWAKSQGIYVLIDMHQDAWSKYIYSTPSDHCGGVLSDAVGWDGAPPWASRHQSPTCALFGVREFDNAVQEAFRNFYDDATASDGVGLQEHYAKVLLALAKEFHDEPAVAGYEILNEPSPGFLPTAGLFDETELFRVYAKLIDFVVGNTGGDGFHQLFFIEPNALRNLTDNSAILTPWSLYSTYSNVVYAPHIYTGSFTLDEGVTGQRFFPRQGGYDATTSDASHMGLPLWVGEFGNDPSDDNDLLRLHYTLQDQRQVGGALWLWKESRSGQWGVYYTPKGHTSPDTLRQTRKKFSVRAYPLYSAGHLDSFQYDPDSATLDLHAHTAQPVSAGDRAHATLLFVPAATTCDVQAQNARLEVFDRGSGSREVYAYPGSGAYRVFCGQLGSAGSSGGGPPGSGVPGQGGMPNTSR